MSAQTEYARYAAKPAGKVHGAAALGGAPAPDEIAQALETLQQPE